MKLQTSKISALNESTKLSKQGRSEKGGGNEKEKSSYGKLG